MGRLGNGQTLTYIVFSTRKKKVYKCTSCGPTQNVQRGYDVMMLCIVMKASENKAVTRPLKCYMAVLFNPFDGPIFCSLFHFYGHLILRSHWLKFYYSCKPL